MVRELRVYVGTLSGDTDLFIQWHMHFKLTFFAYNLGYNYVLKSF